MNRWLPAAPPPGDLVEGPLRTSTFRTYLVALFVTATLVGILGLVLRTVDRWRPRLYVRAAIIAATLLASVGRSGNHLGVALIVIVVGALAMRAPSRPVSTPSRPYIIAAETGLLLWGAWLVFHAKGAGVTLAACSAIGTMCCLRAVSAEPHALEEDARAAIVFAFLPLLGLMRNPSPLYVAASIGVFALIRCGVGGRLRRRLDGPILVGTMTWSVVAAVWIPLRIRDLPLNFDGHEAGHYAWLNSALHGKWLMADASTVYGPLREYLLLAVAAPGGLTVLSVRVAQTLINLAAMALLVPEVWRIARGRASLCALGMFAILIGTHAYTYLDYAHTFSFGWADFARVAAPAALMLMTVRAIAGGHGARRMFVLGALLGLFVFYAQEAGVVAIAAVFAAAGADAWFSGATAPLGVRRRVGRALQSWPALVGALGGMGAFLIPYALAGRLGKLFHTIVFTTAIFASGHGALPFPVTTHQFQHLSLLLRTAPAGATRLEYILPPLVYCVWIAILMRRWILRAWRPEDSVLLSLLVFGIGTFRVALGRADKLHLLSVALPAVLLVLHLLSRVIDSMPTRYRAASLTVALTAAPFMMQRATGYREGMVPRVVGLLRGTEAPTTGQPYAYPGIPRAGDALLPNVVPDIVRFIRENTATTDAIFYRGHGTFGGEFYFLADRRNPTRFDLPHEMFTLGLQREALNALRSDPPKYVISAEPKMGGPEMREFFDSNYRTVAVIGGIPIDTYSPRP